MARPQTLLWLCMLSRKHCRSWLRALQLRRARGRTCPLGAPILPQEMCQKGAAAPCCPPQTLLRPYMFPLSAWTSSRVERSMPATLTASTAYSGGPNGSQQYSHALLAGP